jgi:minor extracellular serine protease Vpr
MRHPSYRRSFAVLASFALLISSSAGMSRAGDIQELAPLHPAPSAEDGVMLDESSSLWFVELTSPPATRGTPPGQLNRERENFRAAARAAGLEFRERYAYGTLWNGLSIEADASQLHTLRSIPGVTAVYPVVTVSIPETTQISPDLGTALAMTGADAAQSELGLTGAGVKVAVMDTGIDYNHPDLGGGWGNRVTHGFDFVGDTFNANPADPAYQPEPEPDEDPMDCNGHGTHVAGIVGADGDPAEGGALGVAPGVTFGAYKVFGCAGSTTVEIMLAAMEMALDDGMDVLNMSIGSAFQWPQYPTGTASDNLVDEGMVVVASIGNNGASGVYSSGSPGNAEKVIGVASFDNSHINALTFRVNPTDHQVAYLPLATTPDPPTEGTTDEVVWVGRGCLTPDPDADPPVPPGGDPYLDDPEGKVALIVRGACTFQEKYQRAADAGATGVVIYNNLTGLFAGGGVTPRDIFGVGISNADGVHIREQLDAGETVTLTWTDERVDAVNPTGGLISSFSSYGHAPDLSLKPDIGAPGGLIRSTYPLALGGYATVSGTSMSSPHVAGAAALVLEAKPDTQSHEMLGVLQNSAEPALWWGNPGLGFPDNVHRQGAGMVDIPGSVSSTTSIAPSKLALGEDAAGPHVRTLTIHNAAADPLTYALSHDEALGTHGNTFVPSFNLAAATVSFSTDSVTVNPGSSASVEVTITSPGPLAPNLQYGGYIVFDDGEGSVHRVPYAGFAGDYQSIVAMTPTPFGFPWLAQLQSCDRFVGLSCTMGASYRQVPGRGGATFQLHDEFSRPYFLVHLDHQVPQMIFEVRDAKSGAFLGEALNVDLLPRNSTSTAFFAFPWDGSVEQNGDTVQLPGGRYLVEIKVLKALGDPDNPAHWESWVSPEIRFIGRR